MHLLDQAIENPDAVASTKQGTREMPADKAGAPSDDGEMFHGQANVSCRNQRQMTLRKKATYDVDLGYLNKNPHLITEIIRSLIPDISTSRIFVPAFSSRRPNALLPHSGRHGRSLMPSGAMDACRNEPHARRLRFTPMSRRQNAQERRFEVLDIFLRNIL
ncbi:MAG TPA: hypothetical protein K8W01_20965 [Methylorubrum populi]|uniref:Uncharacterized protein n=1 Tax=Methylorubrum populi TaxID=223967 RepID=A0A921E6V0_9HYPH|nr:hypothetical protein [Methylorubrum populi]